MASLHHIAIICSSEESLGFYKRLGFVEKERISRKLDTVVFMEGNGIILEIFIDPRHPSKADKFEDCGLRHIAIKVDNFNQAIIDFNIDAPSTDWHGERFALIKDLDGQIIEIHE